MLDFAEWLGSNTAPGDTIILHMDVDGARQFGILQSLLLSDRLSLVSHLFIKWHYQAEVISIACSVLLKLEATPANGRCCFSSAFVLLSYLQVATLQMLPDILTCFVQNWHLVLLWEHILSILGVQFTSS